MAANVWRVVLLLQLLASAGIGAVFHALAHAQPWQSVAVTVGAFVTLQYLFVWLVTLASRALARTAGAGSWMEAARAALGEPLCFLLAELSMARGPLPAAEPTTADHDREPLLLVHGLACNSGVWSWMLPRLRAAGFGPIHAVDQAPFGDDCDALASSLARELGAIYRGRPVTLLAHSRGGLVCRAAQRALGPRWIRTLVTIGTPHHGAALARLLDTRATRQMRTDSPWLAAMNAAQENHLPVAVTSVFSPEDEFVTPAASALLAGAGARALPGLGHFGLLTSRRASDCVVRALREA